MSLVHVVKSNTRDLEDVSIFERHPSSISKKRIERMAIPMIMWVRVGLFVDGMVFFSSKGKEGKAVIIATPSPPAKCRKMVYFLYL